MSFCVQGIGRSCGCERCEAKSSWYIDWLGNIVEVEDKDLYDGDDQIEDDDDEDE